MEVFLKGNYKSFTKVFIKKSNKKTSNILINIHGLYGMSGDSGSKSKKLAEIVTKKGLANAVLFNSSRDWSIFPEDGTWEKQKKAFEGKTFDQELQDVKDTIDLLIDQSLYLFGIKQEKLRFFIVGNSLGGTLATCLDDYFKYTEKIVLAGPGTRTVFPSDLTEKQILNKARKFKGEVMLLQGSKDETVPLEAGTLLLFNYKNAKTVKQIIEGANHSFSKINGKNKRLAYKFYIDSVLKFLQNKAN